MQIKDVDTKGLSHIYEVIVPKDELATKLTAKIEQMKGEVRLKGFRPGKVPVSHIRKMFGKSIMSDVITETVTETSQKVLEEKKLRPAVQPSIEMKSDAEKLTTGDVDLDYKLSVEIIPEFEPADPSKLKLTRLTMDVDDKDITERLEKLGEGQKTYKKKAKTAKAKDGDAVLIDFTGRVDGEAFDGGAMEGHQLVLGSNSFIPGFEEQLVGVKAGDKLDVKVTFPADYQAKDLAGKDAVFETEVHEVQGAQDAEMNDEFAARFGVADMDALKAAISDQAKAEIDGQSRMKLKRVILDELDKLHDFDLPPGMVEAEFGAIWQQVQAEKEAGQLDEDDSKKTDKQLEKDYRKIAERRVRLGLVLAEMGSKQDIQITNEELQAAMVREARNYPGQEQQVFEFYQKNPNAVAQLRAPIYEEKVVDLIIEAAEVKDKKVKRDVLFAEDEGI
ncbi:trigger factor [Robiginitomaculum antarcticum]|uniref:trigger factor n=1 Tax=Robiginitomaculum antarcticum TaxID=437507 RepID=UPI00035E38EB|nr:trigger factor [Robiginitomaculum antarcticum]